MPSSSGSSIICARRLVAIGILLGLCSVVGCATKQAMTSSDVSADPLAAVPDDLTVDLRVLVADRRTESEDADAVTPARFVLTPDGTLHASLNGLHHQRELPPPIRRLNRHQVAELWSLLNQSGLAQPDAEQVQVNPMLIDQPKQGVLYVLDIRAGDAWLQRRRSVAEPDSSAPALEQLADVFAELSWLADQSEQAAMVAPPRYDFGPDPYARYRDNQ